MDVSYIDSHAHIYLDQFRGNIDNIIKNSLNNNVHKILMPNINLDTVTDILKVSDQYKEICYPMLGLHPCYICLLYTSPSPRDKRQSRMPSSA